MAPCGYKASSSCIRAMWAKPYLPRLGTYSGHTVVHEIAACSKVTCSNGAVRNVTRHFRAVRNRGLEDAKKNAG